VNVYDTLDERHQTHGTFHEVAETAQKLRRILDAALHNRKKDLPDDQAEALHMICTKMARVVNGNTHVDTWLDIAGYAMLVVDRLEGKTR
jgi:hypothetical protein